MWGHHQNVKILSEIQSLQGIDALNCFRSSFVISLNGVGSTIMHVISWRNIYFLTAGLVKWLFLKLQNNKQKSPLSWLYKLLFSQDFHHSFFIK